MVITPILLGIAATSLGLCYACLGIAAIKHLQKADQVDKTLGWTLWWCLDGRRYDQTGRRLCKRGQLVAFASIVLWIAAYAVK